MATTPLDRDTILQAVENWPLDDQVTLARLILERASTQSGGASDQSHDQTTWDALYGIASNGRTPPSDEQVAEWLDERRMEKYGR
ncbi:MAG TPA: hypothetical protein VKT52_08665 [Ktedonobacterales bacterium]|nr:hypothetical protein [Ktedonobacterales bacterium]